MPAADAKKMVSWNNSDGPCFRGAVTHYNETCVLKGGWESSDIDPIKKKIEATADKGGGDLLKRPVPSLLAT